MSTNHKEPQWGIITIVNGLGAGNYHCTFHHCFQSTAILSNSYLNPMKQTLPVFYPSVAELGGPQEILSSLVLRRLVFQSRWGPIEHGCASPHSVPNPKMRTSCAVSWSPGLMSCSRALTDTPPKKP